MNAVAPSPIPGSLWSRLTRGVRVVHHAPDWEAFAGPGWADRIMGEKLTDRLHEKQGRSIARWTLTAGDRTLVVYLKRHYVLPRLRGLLAALFPGSAWSPGLEEWRNLETAAAIGLPVSRPVATGQFVGPWGNLQGFLAVEELHDMLPLHEAIPQAFKTLSAETFAAWKRGLVAELGRLSREMHRRRRFHQDLYLCHFYVAADDTRRVPESWQGRVVMIDFHRFARHRAGWPWWQAKDLGQLLYSTFGVAGVTDRDRVRFWKLYRTGDWGRTTRPGRGVRTVAGWRAWNNHRHNLKQARTAG